MNLIYLDNSATTRISESASKEAIFAMTECFANPSARYSIGLFAEKILTESRNKVANALHSDSKNIIFTSGGTESDNLAILGGSNIKVGKHAITTSVEHPAVLKAFSELEKKGFTVTYLDPDSSGVVSEEKVLSALTKETSFVSIMHINNVTGAIMPIENLAPLIKKVSPRALFHVDAVQSFGKVDLFPKKWGIDFLSVSSHKIHGPKGCGALYKSEKSTLHPILFGGGQEGNLRSGTENMPGIAGFAKACEEIAPKEHYEKIFSLKKDFAEKLLSLNGVELNGNLENSSPYILNVSFVGIRSEIMLNALSEEKIFVSAGSSCAKGSSKASAPLKAMDAPHPDNAIRFSFSKYTTKEELDITYSTIIKKLEFLR